MQRSIAMKPLFFNRLKLIKFKGLRGNKQGWERNPQHRKNSVERLAMNYKWSPTGQARGTSTRIPSYAPGR